MKMKILKELITPRKEDLRCPLSPLVQLLDDSTKWKQGPAPNNLFLREGDLSCGAALVSCRAVHVATAAFIAWLERKSMRRINIHCPTDALMRRLF